MNSIQRARTKSRRRLVGLMSGTSADGVDAALIDVESLDPPVEGERLTWELLHFVSRPFPPEVRAEILAVQREAEGVLGRATRLHFVLPHLYADAVDALVEEAGVPPRSVDAVGCHGQTVVHFPEVPEPPPAEGVSWREAWSRPVRGRSAWESASTLQIGSPAVLAERTGLPVLSDFRSRDVAVGGTGAPLVPIVDHALFAHPDRGRLILNVGGIANFTALRPGAQRDTLIALDTGPGNMVVDALVARLSGGERTYDEGGAWARQGKPDPAVVEACLEDPLFAVAPPRAWGREQFGEPYVERFLARCREAKLSDASIIATATALAAAAVHDAATRFVTPRFPVEEVIVSGGGAHNVALLEQLSDRFGDCPVVPSDYYGLDVDAKEAVAFALLTHWHLDEEPGNLPVVTGADRPVLLGSWTPGERFL